MEKLTKEQEIIKLLFKDFLTHYNSRSISKVIGISHVGAFKILKNLEKRNIVNSLKIGNALIYSLNKGNPVTCKQIELALTIEAQNFSRWTEEFKEIGIKAIFVILFGSILKDEETAKDIDLLVVAEKNNFKEIKKLVDGRNKLLNKKIHLIFQIPEDFKKDLKYKNKVILEIINKGVVLFGQEEVRKILQDEQSLK